MEMESKAKKKKERAPNSVSRAEAINAKQIEINYFQRISNGIMLKYIMVNESIICVVSRNSNVILLHYSCKWLQ
jgi:hypothetical protein